MKPLIGMKAIKAEFGVSANTVRSWLAEGAPIISHNEGKGIRYSADYDRLYDWLLKRQGQTKSSQAFWE